MVESRCGILCNQCDYREKVNCEGCVTITKPFWGDACPVKSCCEEKEHKHCGECNNFPCDLLNQFAYNKEQGDDGKRIEQCEKWRTSLVNEIFCESCGMPLDKEEVIGTNKDGSKNQDYCVYCYKDGAFTVDVTMDEMIDISLNHMRELFKDDTSFNEQEALDKMKSFFPKLKRWKA